MRQKEGRTRFHGRQWLFRKLERYLDAEERCNVLLCGAAGAGKTAICAELAQPVTSSAVAANSRLAAIHFCERDDAASLEVATFIRSIADQLAACAAVPRAYARSVRAASLRRWLQTAPCQQAPCEALFKVVVEPLSALPPPPRRLFIVVDSVDEAATENGQASVGQLVALAASALPSWLMLVCTSQAGPSVNRHFVGFRRLTIDDMRRDCVVHDVQSYILSRLDGDSTERIRRQLNSETAEMLDQLHIKSAGCFLYLQLVMDGVQDGFFRLREVCSIPGTLNGLYFWICQRLFDGGKSFAAVRTILEVMLASRARLHFDQLFALARLRHVHLTLDEFNARLRLLGRLLYVETADADSSPVDETASFSVFHPSFEAWLLDVKHCTPAFLCDQAAGHGALALLLSQDGRRLQPDEVVSLASHLSKCACRAPFAAEHRLAWLLQCGADVQSLVLNCPLIDEPTTRLLLQAGADFASLDLRPSRQTSPLHHVSEAIEPSRGIPVESANERVDICQAARIGDVDAVTTLLGNGADVEHAGADGWSPLRSAAHIGHLAVVSALLDYGARVDGAGVDRRTALRAAAWSGHCDVLLRLLAAGADVHLTDDDGRTPLHVAAFMGHASVVEQLLRHGADPNLADTDGRAALHLLIAGRADARRDVCRALLHGGARANVPDAKGRSPLNAAAAEGDELLCAELLRFGVDVDAADKAIDTPLLAAARASHAAVVRLLLEAGANLDAIDSDGCTALGNCAARADAELVADLVRSGCDEMHRDNFGWLPVHHAAFEGNDAVLRVLLGHNLATTDETDNEGRHALILASQEGHVDCVRASLQLGASLHRCGLDGRTALHAAAASGHSAACRLLVDAGADTGIRDLDGHTALFLAALCRQPHLFDCLADSAAVLDAADRLGRTALHVAVWTSESASIVRLVQLGADVNAVDNDGRTALTTALWRDDLAAARRLLAHGADPNIACRQGATSLGVAAQQGNAAAVRLLLCHGADAQRRDVYGRSPRDVALAAGHEHTAALLAQSQSLSPLPTWRHKHTPASSTTQSGSSADKTSGFASLGKSSPLADVAAPSLGQSTTSTRSSCRSTDSNDLARESTEPFALALVARSASGQPLSSRSRREHVGPALTRTCSVPAQRRRRPRIATNPKVRRQPVPHDSSLPLV